MEGNNPYDDNSSNINASEVFQDEVGENGAGNLNAITLYSYATTFLVSYCSHGFLSKLG